jgi:hypothetical protein
MNGYEELAGLVTFRPITTPLPGGSVQSPFRASWSDTVGLLAREVRHLRPRQTIIEADLRESDLRLDGLPRADRNARTPGVILTLIGTRVANGGDLRYPCARFWRWQDNVRAIALALEALRKVDRYGVTKRGEQYAGWKALAAGDGPSVERGRAIVTEHGSVAAALRATHPDHGGDAGEFQHVIAYKELTYGGKGR